MSKRSGGEKQEDIWIAHTVLAVAPGHPFYKRLNELLEGARFDEFVERLCARFYHARLGRPSLRPGIYFRRCRWGARAALNWIDKFGDRNGDGYIEYERKTKLGIDNQCWKDSWNSILFHDGTLAPTPRATCEIQGYAYVSQATLRPVGPRSMERRGSGSQARESGGRAEASLQ
jgi:glycogen debranching enzyme